MSKKSDLVIAYCKKFYEVGYIDRVNSNYQTTDQAFANNKEVENLVLNVIPKVFNFIGSHMFKFYDGKESFSVVSGTKEGAIEEIALLTGEDVDSLRERISHMRMEVYPVEKDQSIIPEKFPIERM